MEGSGHYLSGKYSFPDSDRTGVKVVNTESHCKSCVRSDEEPMYYPTEQSAGYVVRRIREHGLPPGWMVTVESDYVEDYITELEFNDFKDIVDTLRDYKEPQK